ncbi:MAG: DUF4065 domain-containing protein [Bacteroidetes bacterium]|nr:MAG: DUF4065 domain-containing protein [Bacteroidota bacterium]
MVSNIVKKMKILKNINQIDAQLLADFILKDFGAMSHLKLQKLLYYCEAYHLAYFETSLIKQEFEAWVHGPVCKEVFAELKNKTLLYSDIVFEGNYDPTVALRKLLTTDQMELIIDVVSELSTWSGLELEEATHREKPWKDARQGLSPADRNSSIISKNTMMNFYKQELNV